MLQAEGSENAGISEWVRWRRHVWEGRGKRHVWRVRGGRHTSAGHALTWMLPPDRISDAAPAALSVWPSTLGKSKEPGEVPHPMEMEPTPAALEGRRRPRVVREELSLH